MQISAQIHSEIFSSKKNQLVSFILKVGEFTRILFAYWRQYRWTVNLWRSWNCFNCKTSVFSSSDSLRRSSYSCLGRFPTPQWLTYMHAPNSCWGSLTRYLQGKLQDGMWLRYLTQSSSWKWRPRRKSRWYSKQPLAICGLQAAVGKLEGVQVFGGWLHTEDGIWCSWLYPRCLIGLCVTLQHWKNPKGSGPNVYNLGTVGHQIFWNYPNMEKEGTSNSLGQTSWWPSRDISSLLFRSRAKAELGWEELGITQCVKTHG